MSDQPDVVNKKILVIESDFIDQMNIALEFRASGMAAGMDVMDQTIAVLQDSDIGGAILDGNFDSEKSMQIADALEALGIPFVISETRDPAELPARFAMLGMGQDKAGLTLIADQLFGAPTFH